MLQASLCHADLGGKRRAVSCPGAKKEAESPRGHCTLLGKTTPTHAKGSSSIRCQRQKRGTALAHLRVLKEREAAAHPARAVAQSSTGTSPCQDVTEEPQQCLLPELSRAQAQAGPGWEQGSRGGAVCTFSRSLAVMVLSACRDSRWWAKTGTYCSADSSSSRATSCCSRPSSCKTRGQLQTCSQGKAQGQLCPSLPSALLEALGIPGDAGAPKCHILHLGHNPRSVPGLG